jgi:hypothetical protein
MGLRDQLRALRREAREDLDYFELADGSRHWYNQVSPERFLHSMDCMRAQGEGKTTFPEPPETVWAITRAKDRAAALAQVYQSGAFDVFPYEPETLVERGELVPRSMVAGRRLGEVLEDLSEQA